MPKTPLLRSLKRVFTDLQASRTRGVPLSALEEERARDREAAVSSGVDTRAIARRRLLLGAGAAAVGLAVPRISRASGCSSVAIVGAGMGGMACALTLADNGIPATVYEAQNRIGGRMFSNTGYWSNNQVSEWCGELIDSWCTTMIDLAGRFGLPLDDLIAAEPAGSTDTYFFDGAYYSKAQFQLDMQPVYEAAAADLEACGYPITFDTCNAAGVALDSMSVYDWIESRVPGGHASTLGQLLDVAYAAEYGADTTDLSALNLIILLGFQTSETELAALGGSDGRYHIRGGNQRLPVAIADYLGGQSVVKQGHRLLKIKKTSSGRYKLVFQRGFSTVEVVHDYVVLAIPFAVLAGVDYDEADFTPLKDQAIQEQGRGCNSKVQIEFSSRFWRKHGPWGISNGQSYSDTGYQWSWEVSRAQAGTTGILNCYSGGSVSDAMLTQTAYTTAQQSPLVVADTWTTLGRLESVFPGAMARWTGKATQSIPDKSPYYKSSYSYYRVGQYTSFGGYEKVRQGGVLFCGEHTSTEFQGFMEGAAAEGNRAALELRQLILGY